MPLKPWPAAEMLRRDTSSQIWWALKLFGGQHTSAGEQATPCCSSLSPMPSLKPFMHDLYVISWLHLPGWSPAPSPATSSQNTLPIPFLPPLEAPSIPQLRVRVCGWGLVPASLISLSLSLSHTHTHTHVCILCCLLERMIDKALYWTGIEFKVHKNKMHSKMDLFSTLIFQSFVFFLRGNSQFLEHLSRNTYTYIAM